MNELSLIAKIRRMPGVAGVGDDCAVLRVPRGDELLVTTDFLIEDVHFRRETHSASDCGWKALARGLSDIAAMGGDPRHCFVSLAMAEWTDERWIRGFYQGLLKLAARESVTLAGGDLTRARQFTCDIVVLGSVPSGRALLRSGARAGDLIYVSGQLGGSALGLRTGKGKAGMRHRRPDPQVGLGRKLRGRASAAMDLTDGLAMDLHRLCLESRAGAELDGTLPLFAGATTDDALFGGEDYELLCTAPRALRVQGFTRVGQIVAGTAGSVRWQGRPLPVRGWDPICAR